MQAEFQDQVVVVTGGGKGLGQAIALAFVREGADLIVVGRDRAALDDTVRRAQALGRRALAVAADVTDEAQAVRIAEAARDAFAGRVDAVVTAAGTRDHANRPVAELDLAQFDAVLRGNLHGTLLPVRALAPLMQARGRGRHAGGCASKWALEGLARVLAIELGPQGINVNCVCPGYVEGPRADDGIARLAAARGVAPGAVRAELEGVTALKRLSTPDDVANAVLFLASERARNITGQDLVVDAGWMLQ